METVADAVFSGFSILAYQHYLPSQESFLASLAQAENSAGLFVLPKHYSYIPGAVTAAGRWHLVDSEQELLAQACVNTLVIDEGGVFHSRVAELNVNAVGVEQTSNGLLESWAYPVVLVCRSAAKLLFESQIIALGIARKLKQLNLLERHNRFLIMGMGALGSAVLARLESLGESVIGYDHSDQDTVCTASRESVLEEADIILGCSGSESISLKDTVHLKAGCILASCSSKRVEFRSLLQESHPGALYATQKIAGPNGGLHVLNGGFPINFDRRVEWEKPEEIWLTRQLMLAGARQALHSSSFAAAGYKLEGAAQSFIVNEWRRHASIAANVSFPDVTLDAAFFNEHSEGA